MPTGLYDIHDKADVFTPQEIEAGRLKCIADAIQYINGPNGSAIPITRYVEGLTKRWKRACETGLQIDAIRSGYCTIEPKGAPQGSHATH